MTRSAKRSTRRRTPPQSLRAYLAGPPAVSQRMLAEAADCNQSMISMLLRGKRVPSASLAVRLHAITGVSLKNLLAPQPGKSGSAAPHQQRRSDRSGQQQGRPASP